MPQAPVPQSPADKMMHHPIRWSVTAVSIALITALALTAVIQGTSNLTVTYNNLLNQHEAQQAVALLAKRRQNQEATPTVNTQAPQESNRIIVKWNDDAKLPPGLSIAAERANLEKAQGLVKVLTIAGINADVYQVHDDDTAAEVVQDLLASKRDLIEYAEVDMIVYPAYAPNDPYMTNATSWHHTKIGSRVAWDIAKGDGITIAILDSGTNCAHADLAPNCVPGWNTNSNSAITTDINGHGTMTAGNVGSVGDNAKGGAGVAYNAKIMPVRLTDSTDGSSSCSAIASGITYAANNNARVASNSYWVHGCTVTNDAARYLESKGGIYVRAAGNTGASEDSYVSPANEIVHVSATDQNDVRTSWSSFGQFVDVSAPGIGVYCTTMSGGYGSCWGTSFSVPTVSGVFALMFSANPSLTPSQAKSILYSTTDDLGTPGWDQYYGHGRVNAQKAVAAALAAVGARDTTAPTIPTNLRTTSVTSNSATLAWNATTDDNSGIAGYNIYRNGTKLATIAGTSYTNSGLAPQTTYSYTVRAEDVAGNQSADSTTLSVTTPDVAFGVTNYSVPTKTSTTATVATTLTKPGTVTIQYGTTNTTLNLTTESTTQSTTHSVNLTNLVANTTYYYQVVATDGTTTVSSPISSFKTSKAGGSKGGGKPR